MIRDWTRPAAVHCSLDASLLICLPQMLFAINNPVQ
jgi:hypothetical protein